MSKKIAFKKGDIICITLNMSNPHIQVICGKYSLDFNLLQDLKEKKIKYVYIDIKNFFVVAHLFNNKFIIYEPYVNRIDISTLESIKPLSTPKLPKELKPKVDKVVETPEVDIKPEIKLTEEDIDSLIFEREKIKIKISKVISEMESQLEYFVEVEEYEKAAILRDRINKLK
jgi:hypothetical protein